MKHVKLNEESIISRISNGELAFICGGTDNTQLLCGGPIKPTLGFSCGNDPTNPLCYCLAGCGCRPAQTACDICIAGS